MINQVLASNIYRTRKILVLFNCHKGIKMYVYVSKKKLAVSFPAIILLLK